MALWVDQILGQQQVVVKNLESNYRKIDYVSGATIMGDGRVALILDMIDLVRCSRSSRTHARHATPNAAPALQDHPVPASPRIAERQTSALY